MKITELYSSIRLQGLSVRLVMPFTMLLLAVVMANEGLRIAQVLVLALPPMLWLLWPCRTVLTRSVQIAVLSSWFSLFLVDAAIRAYLLDTYQALPNSSLVMAAVANSNQREMLEFLQMDGWSMLAWALFVVLALSAWYYYLRAWWRQAQTQRLSSWQWLCLILVLVLFSVSLALKPWRRHHPLLFWPDWQQQIQRLQQQWFDMSEQRQLLLQEAEQLQPKLSAPLRQAHGNTVVLVIGDSVNRDNMSIYGYSRATSPQLAKLQQDGLLVLPNAWSVDSSTVPALRNLFYFGTPDQENPLHLLALARAAGYRTWWVSNHDDIAIDQEHARLAHVVTSVNQKPGRSSKSLDGSVQAAVTSALDDPAPYKLIVVHLLGAHPHYRLRYPAAYAPFSTMPDAVDAALLADGHSRRAKLLRKEYDQAIHYHDQVLSDLLRLSRAKSGPQSWLYLSDHGQEVVHTSDHIGHSGHTPAGYRIPLLLWQSSEIKFAPNSVARADWLGWSVARLLGVEWSGFQSSRDVLSSAYQWQPPQLPIAVDFYK